MTRRIEKYEVEEELGHGGMATVYRARDTRLDRDVALKILHPHLRASAEAQRRFTREAKSVAKLKHDHILEVYDYSGEDSEESYIAAELLTGPTLKEFGNKHPDLPAEIAVAMALQISTALEAAHESGIVHRDVKPENVMLHEARTLKLTDFGIAQILDTQSFTATGQVLGSPGHMAPEQVETGEVDERSDLFALGTVLYFLACGRLPFTGRNPHQVLRRVMDTEYMDPLRVRPAIGGTLAKIIERCLQRQPEDRYPSAAELSADLRAWCQTMGVDDPDAIVRDFLSDPERTASALRETAVQQLITTGSERMRARDIPSAMDAFNRVLALDDGNPEALRLIASVGQRSGGRWPLVAAALGGLLVVVGVSVAVTRGAFVAADQASVAARDGGAEVGPEGATLGPGLATDRGQDAGGGDGAQASRLRGASDQGATLALAPESGSVDAGGAPAQVNGQGASGSEQSASNPSTAGDRVRSREPRQVLFRPNPANVQISVDGAALRAFGPGFRGVMLTPGRHTFRVVGAADCCEEQTVSRDIPGGQEPFELSMRLAYRAARLYVVANVPGDVAITGAGGTVRGRTREILSVPMVGMDDTRRLTVTAEGHQVYTGVARLRAGQLTEHRASLTLSSAALPTPAPSPAPPPAPDPP